MADHFEFRTTKSVASDPPPEDFTFGYEEIKQTYAGDEFGFTEEAREQEAAGTLPYEEIKVRYPTLDPANPKSVEFVDDVFSF